MDTFQIPAKSEITKLEALKVLTDLLRLEILNSIQEIVDGAIQNLRKSMRGILEEVKAEKENGIPIQEQIDMNVRDFSVLRRCLFRIITKHRIPTPQTAIHKKNQN